MSRKWTCRASRNEDVRVLEEKKKNVYRSEREYRLGAKVRKVGIQEPAKGAKSAA